MNNIKIHCGWDLNFDLFHEKQIELYIDHVPFNIVPPNVVRFVYLLEPPEILNLNNAVAEGMKHNTYNYLLTHNQDLLDTVPNSHLCEFGSTWIKNYQFPDKTFGISTLVGGKTLANGHLLRRMLWDRQRYITNPTQFYISSHFGSIPNPINNPALGDDKSPLFNSQFHIVIENAKRQNWFTEKLIDCLQTKTVPIYWGCPNIGDWFDLNGFIIVDSLEELIQKCNKLTEHTYNEMFPCVEANFEKSQELANIGQTIKRKIETILS